MPTPALAAVPLDQKDRVLGELLEHSLAALCAVRFRKHHKVGSLGQLQKLLPFDNDKRTLKIRDSEQYSEE